MENTNIVLNNKNNIDNMFNTLTNTLMESLPSKNIGGKDTVFYQFEDIDKDDKGKEIVVTRDVTNPALLTNIVKIRSIDLFSKYSSTKLAFCLADFTKEQAEMYKCKNIIDLVYKLMPNIGIDRTTAAKYRKVALWASVVGDDGQRKFRDGIDYDTSVNTLDRCTTLVAVNTKGEKVDLEKCNSKELEEMFNRFYQNYIITGKIYLNASQSKVKEQIEEILKEKKNVVKTIEDDKKNNSENSENSGDNQNNSENSENSGDNQNNSDNSENNGVNPANSQTDADNEESIQKSAEEHINLLKTIFKDNKSALNLLSKLLKEVVNLK